MNNNPAISILSSNPTPTSFTPLSEHQSSTPATFFNAKPVLHASFTHTDVLLSLRDLKSWDHWREVFDTPTHSNQSTSNGTNGTHQEEDDDTIEHKLVYRSISGFITSDSVILFQNTTTSSNNKAISIPYPSISLHATQRINTSGEHTYISPTPAQEDQTATAATQKQALYLQLDIGNPFTRNPADDEDEEQTVELLIVPAISTDTTSNTSEADAATTQADLVKHIFTSLSRCADLHPDPANPDSDEDVDGGEGGGGLAALLAGGGGMPGAGGWITSENVDEFAARFGGDGEDEVEEGGEDGAELGPGAGTRRTRDEGENDDEAKWQRTG